MTSRLQSEIESVLWAHPIGYKTWDARTDTGVVVCRCGFETPYGNGVQAGDANARHVAEVLAQHLEETCKSTP